MTSKEELERVRLSNKCNDYGDSFTRKNFFKLTFDSYTDVVKIINSWNPLVILVGENVTFNVSFYDITEVTFIIIVFNIT